MIVVRNSFVAKPGQASKLAAQCKEMCTILPKSRVLTDLTGDFNRVVMEFEIENLAELDARLQQYATDPEVRAKMQGYTDLWLTGSRELFRIC